MVWRRRPATRWRETAEFAAAAHRGTEAAYAALAHPREGTILSVLRAWARALREMRRTCPSSRSCCSSASPRLVRPSPTHRVSSRCWRAATSSTPVDRGSSSSWTDLGVPPRGRQGQEPASGRPPAAATAAADGAHDLDEHFRFCTEALVEAGEEVIDRQALAAAVAALGESLVIAGGQSRLRVHVHTNEPRLVLQTLARFGRLEHEKVDDMIMQQIGSRTAGIGIVTDSTCEMPERQAFSLGVITVPLTVNFGEESYLDSVDMTLDGFLHRLRTSAAMPTSSQPPAAEFRDVYRRLLQYREGVVSVHIAAAQSGTWQSAQTAAREVDPAASG